MHILRFFSALVVFAHHASYDRFGGKWISFLANYGHEAVVVFFVISGFVITFATDTKENTPELYFASRLSRLLSVVVPALILTAAFDKLGVAMHPELYAGLFADGWLGYLASALFANEIWLLELTPGSNIPFWSLSYEFMYYVIFAAFVFAPRALVAVAFALLAGPKILLLMPAWILGSIAYRKSRNALPTGRALWLAGLGAALALALALPKIGNLYVTWRWQGLIGADFAAAMGHADSFLSDNAIALGLAMHLVGMACLLRNAAVNAAVARAVAKIAESTFCVYLLHYPALYFFTAFSVYATGQVYGVAIGLASLAVGLAMTPPTEWLRRRSRAPFRRAIAALPAIAKRPPAPVASLPARPSGDSGQ